MGADPRLVVSLEARIDRFEKSLKDAGIIADTRVREIEDRFSKFNPSIMPSFAGNFLGNLAGQLTTGVVKFVEEAIGRFKDLQRVAKVTGESMNDIFGLQEVGKKLGAPIEDVSKGFEKIAFLTDEMNRGEDNALTKLLDANPHLDTINRKTATAHEVWNLVADAVQNANTEVQKLVILDLLGQPRTLVRLLEQGSEKMGELRQKAADAAPDLQKLANMAQEFDELWKKAIQNMKAEFMAGLRDATKDLADWLVTVADKMMAFLTLLGTADRDSPFKRWAGEIRALGEALRTAMPETTAPKEAPAREVGKKGNLLGGGTTTTDSSRATTKIPTSEEGEKAKDSYDRQEESIRKHIAAMEADEEAIGKTAGEHERLRTEAALTEALLRAGIEINDEYAARMVKIGDEAEKAGNSLAKRKYDFQGINDSLRFSGNQLVSIMDALFDKTQSLGDVGVKALRAFMSEMLKASIMGEGAFAKLLGFASTTGGVGGLLGMLGLGKNAGGTKYWRGGLSLVGEEGPELVNLPKGASVTPADATRAAMMAQPAQAAAYNGGRAQLAVSNTVHNYAPVEVEQRTANDGMSTETIIRPIDGAIAGGIMRGNSQSAQAIKAVSTGRNLRG